MSEPTEKHHLVLNEDERNLVSFIDSRVIDQMQMFSSLVPEFLRDQTDVTQYQDDFVQTVSEFREIINKTAIALPALENYHQPHFSQLAQAARHCFERFQSMLPHLERVAAAMQAAAQQEPVDMSEIGISQYRLHDLMEQVKVYTQQISNNPVYQAYNTKV